MKRQESKPKGVSHGRGKNKPVGVQAKIGRPTKYKPELMDAICERMAKGESLNAICKTQGYPHESTVRSWVLDDKGADENGKGGVSTKYTRARELQADFWAEDILRIADENRTTTRVKVTDKGDEVTTVDNTERSRLQMDARKWLLSKMFPKKYGDKLDLTTLGEKIVAPPPINLAG